MSPPGDRREPPADTKCPPAAQRKQAKRACSNKITTISNTLNNDHSFANIHIMLAGLKPRNLIPLVSINH